MISICFQGKPFTITVIQVYAPTSNAEEDEQFCEDIQDLLELTPPKRCPFHYREFQCKNWKSRDTKANLALEYKMKQGKGYQSFAEKCKVIAL